MALEKSMLAILDAVNKMILSSTIVSSIVLSSHALSSQIIVNQQKMLEAKAKSKRKREVAAETRYADEIKFISSWKINCGIAIYTEYLLNAMKTVDPNRRYEVCPIGESPSESMDVLHLQHEFGLIERFRYNINDFASSKSEKKIITFHTVTFEREREHKAWCDQADALIVHTVYQKQLLHEMTSKPIHIIPHGSVIFTPIQKNDAREILNLPQDKFIIYIHGFHKQIDDYIDVIKAASELSGVHLCLLISPHFTTITSPEKQKEIKKMQEHISSLKMTDNVTLITKFLTEEEINLYVSASDAILFNYRQPEYVASCSGAMHRVLAGGKPIICTREDSRLDELIENKHALKYSYGNINEMQNCITKLMENPRLAIKLGSYCRKLAFETSWLNIAIKHLNLYDELLCA